jgi:hypothetical protein
VRLVAASIAAFPAAPGAAGCGGSDTKVTSQFTHLVVTYTGAKPAAGGPTIQEDFPCHGP